MSSEKVKTFKLVANNFDQVQTRRHIAGCAIGRDVKVLSFEERRKRLSTELKVTVAGHPRRIREFHRDVSGGAMAGMSSGIGSGDDLLGEVAVWIVVEGVSAVGGAAWRKWQRGTTHPCPSRARTLPPRCERELWSIGSGSNPDPTVSR